MSVQPTSFWRNPDLPVGSPIVVWLSPLRSVPDVPTEEAADPDVDDASMT